VKVFPFLVVKLFPCTKTMHMVTLATTSPLTGYVGNSFTSIEPKNIKHAYGVIGFSDESQRKSPYVALNLRSLSR
jgi:hypothetical protein